MAETPDEFIRSYEKTAVSHDLERTLELIDDDAVYFFSNETQHVGKAAIAEAIKRNFDVIKCETYHINNLKWLVHAETTAVGVFDYAWSGLIEDKKAAGFGRGTVALKSQGGSWRIIHEHLSRGRFIAS